MGCRRQFPCLLVSLLLLSPLAPQARADPRVSVVASADPNYTKQKYDEAGKPRTESYVFMEGKYFEGDSVDPGIEKMTFRKITEFLAPELAKQKFLPGPTLKDSDLLILVHWGTTRPQLTEQEMTGRTSPITDTSNSAGTLAGGGVPGPSGFSDANRQLWFDALEQGTEAMAGNAARNSNLALLGYQRDLKRLSRDVWSSDEEKMINYNLATPRYFIILKAYDLRAKVEGRRNAVWTVHLNISYVGNAFRSAVGLMGNAAVPYLGRTTDTVKVVKPQERKGKVEVGTPVTVEPAK